MGQTLSLSLSRAWMGKELERNDALFLQEVEEVAQLGEILSNLSAEQKRQIIGMASCMLTMREADTLNWCWRDSRGRHF